MDEKLAEAVSFEGSSQWLEVRQVSVAKGISQDCSTYAQTTWQGGINLVKSVDTSTLWEGEMVSVLEGRGCSAGSQQVGKTS